MCHGKVEERKTERTVDQAFDQQCSKDWQLPKTGPAARTGAAGWRRKVIAHRLEDSDVKKAYDYQLSTRNLIVNVCMNNLKSTTRLQKNMG